MNVIALSFYVLLIIVIMSIYRARKRQHNRIQQWKESLHIEEHERCFQQIYQQSNGFFLSQQARQKQDIIDYVYGEIEFLPFLALLSLIQLDEHTVFYDLGCGVGKAVLACAMVYPVNQSVGIEILPELYVNACRQKERLANIPNYKAHACKIKFILGDFLDTPLDDATLVFINATSFFNPTWGKLCARIDQLPQLHTVVTTSKPLISNHFNIMMQTQVEMSWGVVFAYIHVRKKNKY